MPTLPKSIIWPDVSVPSNVPATLPELSKNLTWYDSPGSPKSLPEKATLLPSENSIEEIWDVFCALG